MNAIKAYNITRETGWHYRHLQVQHNNQTFLWVNTTGSGCFSGRPRIHLQTQSKDGPIVAAAALRASRASCRVILGNPDAIAKEDWVDVDSESWSNKQYVFNFQGRQFIWRR